MKTLIVFLMLIVFTVSAYAEQKYNPFTNQWETVMECEELRYNSFSNSWSYEPKTAEIEYNPFENTWEWGGGECDIDNE